MTTRRDFLKIMLATASAPAIVHAANLMPIFVPEKRIITFRDSDGTGWLWNDDEGLLMTAGQLRPNNWIQAGIVWTLAREQELRRRALIIPECLSETSRDE